MRRIGRVGALWALAASAVLAQQQPPPAAGRQEEKKPGGILQDVNLHDLTVAVQRITKKTILWTEDLGLRNKRVHLVSDTPIADNPELLFKAYQSILQVSDLVLIPTEQGGETIYKIAAAPVAPKKPVPVEKGELRPQDRFITRIFSLQYVSPRDVQAALLNMASFPQNILSIESAGLLIATDYDYNIQRFEEIIRAMDVKKPDVEMKVIPLKNAIATEVEQMMNNLVKTLIGRQVQPRPAGVVPGVSGPESVQVVADKRTNAVVLLAEPNRLAQLEDIVRRLDGETEFETSGIYILHLRHTNAVDIARTLNAMYRISVDDKGVPAGGGFGAVRPGQAVPPPGAPPVQALGPTTSPFPTAPGTTLTGTEPTIVADIRSNSVILVTDRNTYKTLEQIVRRLDQRRPQVLIKATVVEVTANQDFDLGVELARLEDPTGRTIGGGRTAFGLSAVQFDSATGLPSITPDVATPGILLLAVRDRFGNIPALLKAFEGRARISILDEPEAATNDNGAAEMKVTTRFPVPQTTVAGTGLAQTSFTFETAETTLSISPHISEGGYLRLETTVKIEKLAPGPSNLPPTRNSREIKTKEIMVPSGQTMVIGGIVTQEASDNVQGIPILSHIPLLGWLFRRTTESEDRRTLYIFLTPYILYDYGFGDYRELTRDRKGIIDRLRGEPVSGLQVELRGERLPESTFRFQAPPPAKRPAETPRRE
ncbi:MAG TPA: secretin N-terminal domain-containing protein [Planctomycetota bacterium]|nr:secretin N-terminal domain-containing protein [Planctomycetota bacterium]